MRDALSRRNVLMLAGLGLLGSAGAANAATKSFSVMLSGAHQVPPVHTKGSGVAHFTYNAKTRHLTWSVSYKNMSSTVTMAHLHGPAAMDKNAKVEVWLTHKGKAVPDPFKGSATLTPAQAKMLMADELYVNVHTKDHPPGEIRGQVIPPKA